MFSELTVSSERHVIQAEKWATVVTQIILRIHVG